jgi:hypothetical protein
MEGEEEKTPPLLDLDFQVFINHVWTARCSDWYDFALLSGGMPPQE